jgi:hypothetical protein
MANKGYKGTNTEGAKGGPVIGETSRFLKTKDQFTAGRLPAEDETGLSEQDYEKTGKSSKLSKETGDKSLKTVKPRS